MVAAATEAVESSTETGSPIAHSRCSASFAAARVAIAKVAAPSCAPGIVGITEASTSCVTGRCRELAALKRTNPEINGRPVDWGTLNDFTIKNMQEAGLQISTRPDQLARPSIPEFFGTPMNRGYTNFYICAVVLILTYIFATLLRQSSFGLMLLAVKTNQTRMDYMGLKPKRYTLAAFVISAMFAGLAGALFVAMDPNAPPDRMEWTESGKVVIMNILGGMGSVVGPFIGALIVKYFGNIISSIDVSRLTHTIEETLPFPAFIEWPIAHLPHLFVGEGWELGMGLDGLFVRVNQLNFESLCLFVRAGAALPRAGEDADWESPYG